jgi:hypothetical protein
VVRRTGAAGRAGGKRRLLWLTVKRRPCCTPQPCECRQTGALAGGAPSVALAGPGGLVLRGGPDADLTQTLYGLQPGTGAVVWTKTCSGGCTLLQVRRRAEAGLGEERGWTGPARAWPSPEDCLSRTCEEARACEGPARA